MDKKKDKQFIVKIVCVLASFIFWIYVSNTQNPERTRSISVPITIENKDALSKLKLVLGDDQPTSVSITVKGPMVEINKLDISKFKMVVDLSGYAFKQGKNSIPVRIVDKPDDIVVLDPDSLRVDVDVDTLIEKSVQVKVKKSVTTKDGYTDFQAVPTPNSVSVSGPSTYVDDVDYVAVDFTAKNLDSDYQTTLPLKAYDKADRVVNNVTITPNNAQVIVPVKKKKTVNVNVKTTGSAGTGLQIKGMDVQPTTVEIAGDDNAIKLINSIDTEPIDLGSIKDTNSMDVKLVVPNNVTLMQDKSTVTVKVTVDKISQKNLNVDIKFNNLGQEYNYESDKTSISLILSGSDSTISNINAGNISCIADLSNLKEGDNYNITLNVTVPQGVQIVSYSPQTVKVKITKKQ
ncbi:hypothetical protein IAI10_04285 [Clostridium sp. 19966]|uniref:CdaR family protein n=1 Tax=Clostridium sp. 19966 TaxID=2768166 RepID=UPI0028DEF8C4|nr:CdaR family protein [Clostridium sp. 19966]MDT8715865.1 hypothetical protein [Clostridium sp. 19966]